MVARAPLRLSLAGGGSDLPEWFDLHGGSFLSQAIDLYVRVEVSESRVGMFSFNGTDAGPTVETILNPYVRAACSQVASEFGELPPLEIISRSDLPPGSGLGSSGAWLAALVEALTLHLGVRLSPLAVALRAYEVERDLLQRTIGLQDQVASSLGGCIWCQISTHGELSLSRPLSRARQEALVDRVLLVPTDVRRDASKMLQAEVGQGKADEFPSHSRLSKQDLLSVDRIRELVGRLASANEESFVSMIMDEWKLQTSLKLRDYQWRFPSIWERYSLLSGYEGTALKLVGAGGGGYFAVLFDTPERKCEFLESFGSPFVDPKASAEGVRVLEVGTRDAAVDD